MKKVSNEEYHQEIDALCKRATELLEKLTINKGDKRKCN